MQLKGHRLYHASIAILFACLILAILALTNPLKASPSATPPVQFITLIGEKSDIDWVLAPFAGKARLVRAYPDVADYLDESPINYFPTGLPTNPVIYLVHLTVPPVDVSQTISDIQAAILPVASTVKMSASDLQYLSHVPKQLVVHGNCSDMDNLDSMFNMFLIDEIELDYSQASLTPCIHLYGITSGMVDAKIAQINATGSTPNPPQYPAVFAERNFLTSGYMGVHHTFGSGGQQIAGATVTTTPSSPLPTTGNNVQVTVFDTSPYLFTTPSIIADIDGKLITVRHDYNIPPLLPEKNPAQSDIAAHGTMVSSPILDMAPDVDLLLQRVLNDDGIGNGYIFYKAIDEAARQVIYNENSDYYGVIFNYSLGLDVETDVTHTTLYRLMSEINQLGIVQVAASGNGSAHAPNVQPMTLPAAHPNVIGIAALAATGQLACYSNAGDLAVMGGGAPRGAMHCDMDTMVEACASSTHNDCMTGWDPNSTTGYSWGVGTSLAAPIVTGFAAQIIEALATAPRASETRSATNFPIDPAKVLEELQARAQPSGEEAGAGNLFTSVPTAVEQVTISAETITPLTLILPISLLTLFTLIYLVQTRRK